MTDNDRILTLLADGKAVAEGLRIHVTGRASMSCTPDAWCIDVYNLPSTDRAELTQAATVTLTDASGGTLVWGHTSDVTVRTEDGNTISTLLVTDGESLQQAHVALSLSAGATWREAMSAVIAHSSVPMTLMTCPAQADASRLPRGMACFGSTLTVLGDMCASFGGRLYTRHGAVYAVCLGDTSTATTVSEDDLRETPAAMDGVQCLRMDVVGLDVGRLLTVDGATWRILAQSIDADNRTGAWRTDVLLLSEGALNAGSGNHWEGMT